MSGNLASVVICTSDRGASVVDALKTVLINTYENFEVILIDQSSNNDTQDAIADLMNNPRLKYVRSNTKGSGRAHNIGLAHAQGEIVLYTDDDCTVPPNWIDVMVSVFDKHPKIAVTFCNVDPAPHDSTKGFIPIYVRKDSKLVRTLWEKCSARGIGAGMAVRRDPVLSFGGFDNSLGPGGKFRACMDGDLAVRAILNNWWVYETHEVSVLHYGFRTWEQGRSLSARAWYGIGAAYVKPLKCGRLSMLVIVLYEAIIIALLEPLLRLVRFKKPQGIKQIWHFLQGFFHGFLTPICCKQIVYEKE
jgi:glycosyltransferase involved in cell wall biosynthesis